MEGTELSGTEAVDPRQHPDEDVPVLKEAGVAAVFGPGTTIGEVAEFLRSHARARV